jgi:hypothetical protein
MAKSQRVHVPKGWNELVPLGYRPEVHPPRVTKHLGPAQVDPGTKEDLPDKVC